MIGVAFDVLKGKVLADIQGLEEDSEKVVFACGDGTKFSMHHDQGYYEHVRVVDVCGKADHLLGREILVAEESSNSVDKDSWNTATWTFYKLITNRGCVVIRWLGESGGCCSERVSFTQI